jgi:hypothetical protein
MSKMDINIVHIDAYAQNMESWVAMTPDNEVIGHIFMLIEKDNKIKFLDAWVHENHRRKGIFRVLWDTRWDYVQKSYKGWLVYAWCKPNSLPLLLEKGFESGEIVTYVEKVIG